MIQLVLFIECLHHVYLTVRICNLKNNKTFFIVSEMKISICDSGLIIIYICIYIPCQGVQVTDMFFKCKCIIITNVVGNYGQALLTANNRVFVYLPRRPNWGPGNQLDFCLACLHIDHRPALGKFDIWSLGLLWPPHMSDNMMSVSCCHSDS